MTKPVDCLFFFTKHPQLGVSCCSRGALGVCIPAVALAADPVLKPQVKSRTPLNLAGKIKRV